MPGKGFFSGLTHGEVVTSFAGCALFALVLVLFIARNIRGVIGHWLVTRKQGWQATRADEEEFIDESDFEELHSHGGGGVSARSSFSDYSHRASVDLRDEQGRSLDNTTPPPKIGSLLVRVQLVTSQMNVMVGTVGGGRSGRHHVHRMTSCAVVMQLWRAADLRGERVECEGDEEGRAPLMEFNTCEHKESSQLNFNENFKLDVPRGEGHVLVFSLVGRDRFSRRITLGEAELTLDSLHEEASCVESFNLPLYPIHLVSKSGLLLSLNYLPLAERLCVIVMKARDLEMPPDQRTDISVYVKVEFFVNERKVKKKKTSTKSSDTSPTFNESLGFDVPRDQLANSRLVIYVVQPRLGSEKGSTTDKGQGSTTDKEIDAVRSENYIFGTVCIGGHSCVKSERQHFEDMVGAPRRPVARWHSLKNFRF